jgi:arginine decarboxylase
MRFSDKLPMDGLEAGADATVQSTHKMIGSLTQSSMLHVQSDRLSRTKLKTTLQLLQSTSPSYVLMSSLDAARSHMACHGPAIFEELLYNRNKAQLEIEKIPGIVSLSKDIIGHNGIYDFDPMRLVLSAEQLGLEGYQLYDMLYKNYNIEMEFADHAHCVAVLGPGTTAQDLEKLIDALRRISAIKIQSKRALNKTLSLPGIPPKAMNPREAFFAPRKRIPWEESKGKVSAEMITPYPPGIPVLCPGEVITEEIWMFLDEQRQAGRHLHGPLNGVLDFIDIVH